MLDAPPPFALTFARVVGAPEPPLAFLEPGGQAVIELPQAGSRLESLESHGSRPDYSFETLPSDGRARVRVRIASWAEDGERLVIARSRDGGRTVGLVGIHILGKATR
jgi:hypothetical protein